jgi:hypothetical protein
VSRHEEVNNSLFLTKYDYGEKTKSDGVDRYVARMVSTNTYAVLVKKKPERKKV